uniref:Hexosyltransferase n=1 Tax=Timema californicum TaxID=61474 RepID=A0A7R9JEP1_TIMCA|nr:unnamed protein product [Timema californicum]
MIIDVHKRRSPNPPTQIKPLVAHPNQMKNGIHLPPVSSNPRQEHNPFGYRVVLRWCLMLLTLFLVMVLIQLVLLPFPSEERDDTHFQFLRRSREPIHYLRPKNMTTLVNPQYFCDSNHRLLIMVASAPSNTEQRQAIRETWGQANFEIRIIFFMGRSSDGANDVRDRECANGSNEWTSVSWSEPVGLVIVEQPVFGLSYQGSKNWSIDDEEAERLLESAQHGDIVVEDFIDTHENLTLKTLFMLKWTFKHCNQFSYWVKTSDDVLLNTKGILKHLEHFGVEKKPMIIGYRKENMSPERSRTSSHYMPLWLYESKVCLNMMFYTQYRNRSNKYTELRSQFFVRSKPFFLRLTGQPAGLTHSFQQSFVSGSFRP